MIWSHRARMHWVSSDLDGVDVEVKLVGDEWLWSVIDMETGEVLYHGKCYQALDAMRTASGYINALKEIRNAFKEEETRIKNQTYHAEEAQQIQEDYW